MSSTDLMAQPPDTTVSPNAPNAPNAVITASSPSRHAVLILAHKNPRQIALVASLLADAHSDVFVHLDASSAHLLAALPVLPGVQYLSQFRVTWGGFSMVRATLALMRRALSTAPYTRLHLISAQCLPLWPIAHIRAYYDRLPNAEYMHCQPFPVLGLPYHGFDRILVDYPLKFQERFRSVRSQELEAYKLEVLADASRHRCLDQVPRLFHGSQWFSVTSAFASFVLEAVTSRPELTAFFSSSLIPDEMFFQTLLMMSPFAHAQISETGRFLNWTAEGMRTLCEADIIPVLDSGKMFARKADIEADEATVARIVAASLIRTQSASMSCQADATQQTGAALFAATAKLSTLADINNCNILHA